MTAGRATVQTEDLLKVLFVLLVVLLALGTDPALGTSSVPKSLPRAFGL
ncbi:hypothetical protein M0R88_06085 [Halorussus gelatinilyticus]|uniref:Uncharacterized protein n=1 Tax=Halorussus gelatinilyticus TaxID=2937524 RepID=A0A8U0IKJ8_9EURY|nr:hypothetical protein [Halorussus gelatinilyticus]UPW01667.1 hypothetical protein M0R88_06085 [Halorussus gelatinilyticus]